MNFLDLEPDSPILAAVPPLATAGPDSVEFDFSEGFEEAQILEVRHDARRQKAVVLFEFRVSLWPLPIDMAVLVLAGVSKLSWDQRDVDRRSSAHSVLSTATRLTRGKTELRFENVESSLTVRFSDAFLLAGDQPQTKNDIPNYSWPENLIGRWLPSLDLPITNMSMARLHS